MDILLVEDDHVDARLVGQLLNEAEDFPYSLTRVGTVSETLTKLGQHAYAAILLDLGLPDGNGLETLEAIRPFADGAAIILLTGNNSVQVTSTAFVAGAHDYLVKGKINSDNLIRSLRYSVQRKQAEIDIRKSQALYKSLVENLPQLIIRKDRKGRFTYVNERFLKFHNLTLDQILGKTVFELFPPDLARKYAAEDEHVLQTGELFEDIQKIPGGNDGTATLNVLKIPIREHEGDPPSGIQCVHQDVTQKQAAETKIREQANLLNMTHEAIIGCDLQGRIRFWNRGAELLYGIANSAMTGKLLADFPGPSGKLREQAFAALQVDGEWSSELEQESHGGHKLTVDSRWTLVPGEHGAQDSIIVINSDITKRKSLEREFLRAQRLESLGTLAGGIAHDLNNVLSPIMTGLSLIQNDPTSPDFGEIVEMMQESVDRGARIVQQILSFARGSTEDKTEIHLRHLAGRLVHLARATFPPNIEIHSQLPDDLWPIEGDATQLEQAIMNLLVNARDAMPKGGVIAIKAGNIEISEAVAEQHYDARPGPHLRLTVQDTGSGIPTEILDKIFDPFFTTKEVGKGTGLGLSTVTGIVKNHQGFMTVESHPGQGTQFVIHFPVIRKDLLASPSAPVDEPPRGSGETILLVDDERHLRELMKRTLEHHGYRVLEASHGAEAIACLANPSNHVDLMIVDLVMPVMDGPATVTAARHFQKDLPILVVSGSISQAPAPLGSLLSEIPWLRKPCATSLLLKTVRDLLNPDTSPDRTSN